MALFLAAPVNPCSYEQGFCCGFAQARRVVDAILDPAKLPVLEAMPEWKEIKPVALRNLRPGGNTMLPK